MLSALRRVLSFEMTIAGWIAAAVILAVPYLVVGAAWTATHTDQLDTQGVDHIFAILRSIVSWPALLVSAVCLA
jgi:hypothetical protein